MKKDCKKEFPHILSPTLFKCRVQCVYDCANAGELSVNSPELHNVYVWLLRERSRIVSDFHMSFSYLSSLLSRFHSSVS